MIEYGNDWADKNAAADALEEAKKSVLAQISISTNSSSVSSAEREALASSLYAEHLDKMIEARRVANRARVAYDAVKTLAELRRSEESTRRAEMNLV